MKHTDILNAYVGRLNSSQLKLIYEQAVIAERASSQLGLNAQAKEHVNSRVVTKAAIDSLCDYDRTLISKIIKEHINGDA